MDSLEKERIIAMAVAAIAEENRTETKQVVVRSFKEIKKSGLEQFIEDNNIDYHKYQLEDSM